MSTPADTPRGGSRAFAADFTLSILAAWFLLWCIQSSIATDPNRFWAGWLPLVVAVAFIVIGSVLGAAYKSGRGYLPVPVRWSLLAICVVLLTWAVIDTASGVDSPPEAVAQIQARARADAEAAVATAKTPVEKQIAKHAVAVADGLDELAELLEAAEDAGISTPSAPPTKDAPASPGAQSAALLRRYGNALADGSLPPELEAVAEPGQDIEDMLLKAGLGLAAQALANYLGMPYLTVIQLLFELLADGELTAGEIIRLATAVAFSIDSSGNLVPDLLADNFQRIGQSAEVMIMFMERAEKSGLDQVVSREIWDTIKGTATEVAGSGPSSTCDEATVRHIIAAEPDRNEQVRLLGLSDNEACRRLSSKARSELLEKYGRD